VQRIINQLHILRTERPSAMRLLLRVIELVEKKLAWSTSLFRVIRHEETTPTK
jgi:hypothetical protein